MYIIHIFTIWYIIELPMKNLRKFLFYFKRPYKKYKKTSNSFKNNTKSVVIELQEYLHIYNFKNWHEINLMSSLYVLYLLSISKSVILTEYFKWELIGIQLFHQQGEKNCAHDASIWTRTLPLHNHLFPIKTHN